jgi:protein-tyrosine-phosphatase
MAEGILRHLTGGLLFVRSGGVIATSTVHPMAVKAMAELGVSIHQQSVSTLASLAPHAATYDVYVGIDEPRVEPADTDPNMELTFQTTPSHWTVVEDASDMMRKTHIYSPRDHRVANERSTRRFQDSLYLGEPPFPVMMPNRLRLAAAVRQEHWAVADVAARLALETEEEHMQRVRVARDIIVTRAVKLLTELEQFYGEQLVVQPVPRPTAPAVKLN